MNKIRRSICLAGFFTIVSYVFAEENSRIIPLITGTTRQLEVVVKSSDRKPVVKLLKPDYAEICEKMIPYNYFSLQYTRETRPDVHSLTADTPLILHSPRIPLVWTDTFYYGRFLTKCNADIKKWEVRVIDSHGKKIIRYKGAGKPPENVDLREEDVSKFHTGEPYSPVLLLTTKNGKKYSFYGQAFSFDILIKKMGRGSICVELNSKALFDNDNILTKKGEYIILGLRPFLIRMRNPSVEIRTRTSQEKISRIRTYNIVDVLSKEFFIPIKNIKANLYIHSGIDYPSIEIIIKTAS